MGFSIIIARLLAPATFGLIAMANLFLRFGSYFSTMGLSQAIIQRSNLTNDDIRTAFTFSIILGVVFAFFICLFAPAANYIFGRSDLVPIVRALALSLIIAGMSNTALGLIRRQLRFKAMALVDISSYLFCYGGLGLVLAWKGFGVWSLVIASLAQGVYQAIMAYILTMHDLRPALSSRSWKEMSAYGSKTSVISFIEFIGASLDTIIIGRILGVERLGYYNRAQMLSNLPAQYFTTSYSRVLFPSIASISHDLERLQKAHLKSLQVLSFLLLPTYAGVSIVAEPMIHVFLGNQWISAIPVLKILALAAPLSMLSHLGGILCDATGKFRAKFKMQVIYIVLAFLLLVSLGQRGLVQASLCILIVEIYRFIAYLFITNKLIKIHLIDWFITLKPSVYALTMVSGSIFIVLNVTQSLTSSSAIQFISSFITGALTLLVFLFARQNRILRSEIVNKIRFLYY